LNIFSDVWERSIKDVFGVKGQFDINRPLNILSDVWERSIKDVFGLQSTSVMSVTTDAIKIAKKNKYL
jgi:hypothetical protein